MRSTKPLKVGLIGLGAIGSVIARELEADKSGLYQLVGTLSNNAEKVSLESRSVACRTLVDLLDLSPDVVVEAAGHFAVLEHGPACLHAGCDLLVVSVGALADQECLSRLVKSAAESGRQVLLPAGALGGLDYLGASQRAGLSSVVYRGRKPPAAWLGTPADQTLDLLALKQVTTIFRGSARQACQAFPKNANVAATLALATVGFDCVQVELLADPTVEHNVHEIEAIGSAGRFMARFTNAPSPDNPKTSMVTPFSVLRTLASRRAPLSF